SNNPQNSFRPDEDPVRAGTSAGSGQAPRFNYPGRRDHADRLHEIVDMRVEGGEVATRAGRDPSTQRGKFKRLWKIANGVAVRAKLIVQRRTEHASLNTGRPRNLIHFEYAVQMLEIDRNRAAIAITRGRLDSPNHAGAAAKRRSGEACTVTPFQHLDE